MDDLISRKALLALLKRDLEDAKEGTLWTGSQIFKRKEKACKEFIKIVEQMPPAYDFDTVLAELESRQEFTENMAKKFRSREFCLESEVLARAIKTIKKGVKND